MKHKEDILKEATKKLGITYRQTPILMIVDFSLEAMEAKKKGTTFFKY